MSKNWLESLRPGDTVIIDGHREMIIDVVKRITKTQIIVGKYEIRFRKVGGYEVGASVWSRSAIIEATEERLALIRERIKRARLLRVLSDCDFGILKTETLERLVQISKEAKEI